MLWFAQSPMLPAATGSYQQYSRGSLSGSLEAEPSRTTMPDADRAQLNAATGASSWLRRSTPVVTCCSFGPLPGSRSRNRSIRTRRIWLFVAAAKLKQGRSGPSSLLTTSWDITLTLDHPLPGQAAGAPGATVAEVIVA